ncbi:hypothetical protein ACSBR1_043840 [Camellia fascicularis]
MANSTLPPKRGTPSSNTHIQVYDSFTRGDPIIDSSASSRYEMASIGMNYLLIIDI